MYSKEGEKEQVAVNKLVPSSPLYDITAFSDSALWSNNICLSIFSPLILDFTIHEGVNDELVRKEQMNSFFVSIQSSIARRTTLVTLYLF